MTRLVAHIVTWLALLAVMLVAGGHTIYYLFEWEWVRSQIASVVFVASLVVAATMLVLARLSRVERRLDMLASGAGTPGQAWIFRGSDRQADRSRPRLPWC